MWFLPAPHFTFLSLLAGFVSITTLTVLAYERYIRVVHSRVINFSWTWRAITYIWLYSLAWAGAPLLGWNRYILDVHGLGCTVDWKSKDANDSSFVLFLFLGCLAVPLGIITHCYGHILYSVRMVSWRLQGSLSETCPYPSLGVKRIKLFLCNQLLSPRSKTLQDLTFARTLHCESFPKHITEGWHLLSVQHPLKPKETSKRQLDNTIPKPCVMQHSRKLRILRGKVTISIVIFISWSHEPTCQRLVGCQGLDTHTKQVSCGSQAGGRCRDWRRRYGHMAPLTSAVCHFLDTVYLWWFYIYDWSVTIWEMSYNQSRCKGRTKDRGGDWEWDLTQF